MLKKIQPKKIFPQMIGSSSDEESDEGGPLSPPRKRKAEEDDASICVDDLPLPSGIQFLPENKEELCAHASELFKEFEKGKYTVRNELVFIFDELKRRGEIEPEEYRRLNDHLSAKQGSGLTMQEEDDSNEEMEEEEDMLDVVGRKIVDTSQYLIEHDKRELERMFVFFEDKVDTYYEDVAKLRELAESWIGEVINGKDPSLDNIRNLLNKLEESKILKSSLIRFETILKDIQENRYRVTDVLRPMSPVLEYPSNAEDQLCALNRLAASETITDSQYNELKGKMEEGRDLDDVISVLKQTKIGRGIKFLPRLTNDLFDKLKDWIALYADEKTGQLRGKLLAILDELLQRKAISKRDYQDKIEQHDL